MAEARMVAAGSTPGRIVPAIEVIRRFVNKPFAGEEIVLFVELVILVNLQQRARNRKTVVGGRVIAQRARVLPHAELLAEVT
jgi:hypothetical protein